MASSLTDSESLVAFGNTHVTKGLGRIAEGVIAQGEGSYVRFEDGRRALDFTCGIGVTNLGRSTSSSTSFYADASYTLQGHCHPTVSKAAAEQCMKLVHGQVRSIPRTHLIY